MPQPTDQQLDHLTALADAATPGPWHLTDSSAIVAPLTADTIADVWEPTAESRNGEFIEAMSPEVAKALVAEVSRLRAELAAARAQAADEVIEWSGQQIGIHVPTVDAIADLLRQLPAVRSAAV